MTAIGTLQGSFGVVKDKAPVRGPRSAALLICPRQQNSLELARGTREYACLGKGGKWQVERERSSLSGVSRLSSYQQSGKLRLQKTLGARSGSGGVGTTRDDIARNYFRGAASQAHQEDMPVALRGATKRGLSAKKDVSSNKAVRRQVIQKILVGF